MKIAVLGSGGWGTALAMLLAGALIFWRSQNRFVLYL